MFEVAGEEVQAQAMDHHGLVAAVCSDLKVDPQRKVSLEQAVVAMILNGLGFINKRLYLSHQFFANKPIEALLGDGISALDITNHALSHTLDEIARYGSTKLYGEAAFETVLENNLLFELNHLATTSLSVHGQYEVDDAAEMVELTKELVGRPAIEFTWQAHDKGYQTASFSLNYGGQPQRWLLVFSEQALTKALWRHVGNEVFNCQQDAAKAIERLKKQYPLHIIKHQCEAVERYPRLGKPKAGEDKQVMGYQVKAQHERHTAAIRPLLLSKGRFILATNDLNTDTYLDKQLLEDYKDQQGVERC